MNFKPETLLENLCRTCMGEGKDNKTISMFNRVESIEDNITIVELLMTTIPELNNKKGEVLPKVLCGTCVERLINAYEFQKMCIRVEEKLLQIINERTVVPLVDKKKDDEKEHIKCKTEENQWSSDSSVQFEDDRSSGNCEWETKTRNPEAQNFENNKNCPENCKNDEESKNFVCHECGRRCMTKRGLKKHKRVHLKSLADQESNRKIAKYKCEFCGKAYLRPFSLRDHITIHAREKLFLCSICGKSFDKASSLYHHSKRHTTEKSYLCPVCPKRFRCVSDLSSHKLTHSNKKPYVCDVCGAGFALPYILKKHQIYHSGERNYKCDYCEKRFFLKYQYRTHIRTHTGEKPYKCKYCDRAFSQSYDLSKHLRLHVGDNIYRCDLCPRGFRLQRELLAHSCIHKNEDEETRVRNLQALKEEEQKIKLKYGIVDCK